MARHPRRGVTLIEMLVVVALLVLMMTIIVQIFQAATGSVTAAKAYQELDDSLRELDATLRADLAGVTARTNAAAPPDPKENLGYFEYIENSWADAQGEDSDDCLRFTAQSPPGQPFTGRMYVYTNPANFSAAQAQYYLANQPITITSQYAEIIYFLRNGNLYRRVLLIAPERQAAVNLAMTAPNPPAANFSTGMIPGGVTTSWLGVNDLSARPSGRGPVGAPILNTLGDLTNRENRAFSPRFSDDYNGASGGPDGVPDDFNTGFSGVTGDGVPDYYPTMYPGVFNLPGPVAGTLLVNTAGINYPTPAVSPTFVNMPFPYIFPGAYSQPDPGAVGSTRGWIHSLDPAGSSTNPPLPLNHLPLDVGDSLAQPTSNQTWWGFPTWRETLSANWLDPVWQVQNQGVANKIFQTYGLQPRSASAAIVASDQNLLPPASLWFNPQLFNDGFGTSSKFLNVYVNASNVPIQSIWEDDLIMTGVRSFDVKALDDSVSTYVDLGNSPANSNTIANQLVIGKQNFTANGFQGQALPLALNVLSTSLAHEGVMPPRGTGFSPTGPADYRFDPQAQAKGIFIPIGDDQTGVIRLRRTYDTWSTEYTQAPATGFDPTTASLAPFGLNVYPPSLATNAQGTIVLSNPVYPSYPAPYPVPLRGIQIQVRVTDPRNERVKVLTIRQDFSDKISKKP
jgi:prepilin-type N-terminal cleavage/methylation domain-containing protein